MHFIAAAALVGSALASNVYYETTAYHTAKGAVYTSVSTCSEKAPYKAPYTTPAAKPYGYVHTSSAHVYAAPTAKPVYYSSGAEVTYTSYYHVTVTSCEAYVTNCPAKVYSSAVYSVSTCTEETYAHPTPAPYGSPAPYSSAVPYGGYSSAVPYYSPPSNTTTCSETPYAVPTYVAPSPYAVPTYTNTYYTTVCAAGSYCYGTTVTSTYCPTATPVVYSTPAAVYTPAPVYTPTYVPVSSPCPTANSTATYAPPPSYTGAASSNSLNFGLAAVAGLVALFIAA